MPHDYSFDPTTVPARSPNTLKHTGGDPPTAITDSLSTPGAHSNPTNEHATIIDHHIPNTVETITYDPNQDPDMTTTLHTITPHMKQTALITITLPNGTPLTPPQPLTEFLQQVHEILEQQRCDPQ